MLRSFLLPNLLQLLIALTLFSLPIPQGILWAQQDTGTLTGTVKDASGAAVPGVSLTITNVDTNQSFKTTTNESGFYAIPFLRPGRYSVNAEKSGFKTLVRSGIVVQVNQVAVADVTLELGALTQKVEVTAQLPLLHPSDVTLGDVIGESQVKSLPLNGRNFVQLLTLSAGVAPGSQEEGTLSSRRGTTAVTINGNNTLASDYLLNGIDNNETTIQGIVIFPPIDAIQEFKVQTAASSVEFGRNSGGQVNVTLKSGTNHFHGDAFEFFRSRNLDARNFFDNPNFPNPEFILNQFGGTAGGPIIRDRTFWFGDYQGSRIRQGQSFLLTVPTARMRQGDLAELGPAIFDPKTFDPATNTRQQFKGNVIPPDRLSNAAQNLIAVQYPLPNLPGTSNNLSFNPVRVADSDAFDLRGDHRISDRDTVSASESFSDFRSGETVFAATVVPNSLFGNTSVLNTDPTTNRGELATFSWNHIFSPTAVNNFRAGFTRINEVSLNRLADIKAADRVGIPGVNDPRFAFTNGLPQIGISGFSSIGELSFLPFISRINTFQFIDDLTVVRGNHTVKFGMDVRRRQFNFLQPPSQRGIFSFTGAFTNNPASPGGTGSGLGDFLLGLPLTSSQEVKVSSTNGQRSTEWAWWAGDTWKLTPKLTLDYGLRYELTSPRTEVYDRQSNFDPLVPGGAFRVASLSAPPCGRALRCFDHSDFAPRFGIAYQANDKTVVRSAYGIFYDVTGFNGFQGTIFSLFQNPPFTVGQNIINSTTRPTNRLEDGFPPIQLPVPVTSGGLVLPNAVPGFTFSGRFQDYRLKTPYAQTWHFTIERQVTPDLLLSAAYVGTKGTRVLQNLGINQPRPGPGPVAPRRPFPGFADINEEAAAGRSTYHSLQMKAEQRFSHGLAFLSAWTYSKALGDCPGQGGCRAQDFTNRRAEKGPTDFDVRHRSVTSFTWDLPFGNGSKYLSGATGALGKVAEGWQFGGIMTFQSGTAFTPTLATAVSNTAGTDRPNRVCNGRLAERTASLWFNPACFKAQDSLTFGNSGVGILTGPSTREFDLTFHKNTYYSKNENRFVQFRAEFFNIFNTPQFNNPNASIGSPGAGKISSAGNKEKFIRTERQIQFALKFFW